MAQDAEAIRTAETLRDRALEGTIAYDVVEQITTRFGPRLAGTESERAAAAWGEGYMRELGLQNVRVHEFPLAVWNRGVERVEVLSPFPQPLTVTALGGAMATSEEGVTGEAVIFRADGTSRARYERPRDLLEHFDHDIVLVEGFKELGDWPKISISGDARPTVDEVAANLDRIWRS